MYHRNNVNNDLKNQTVREPLYDIIKGILIFLVVFGHCIPEELQLHKWIYSFHIPAFFIVDGILLRHTNFIKKNYFSVFLVNIKSLLFPYIVFSIILMFLRWQGSGFSYENIRYQLIDMITLCGIGAMWFLPCMLIARLIFRITICNKLLWILCGGLFILPFYFEHHTFIGLVMFRSFIAVGFIYVGYLILPLVLRFSKMQKIHYNIVILIGCMLISFFTLIVIKEDYALNVLKLKPAVGYIISAISGTIIIVTISLLIKKYLKKFTTIFTCMGRSSLYIMGLHQSFMLLIPKTYILCFDIILNTLISIVLSIFINFSICCFQNRRKQRNE